jgi:hypothetical protein
MLTHEQHAEVYEILDREITKASRALSMAIRASENVAHAYGGSVEAEATAVIVEIRRAQLAAASGAARDYFNSYISPAR